MIRLMSSLIAVVLACLGAGQAAADPVLRPNTVIEGTVIHLGDLFADAGVRADDVVAPAPPPGTRTIFNAAWLSATAREHQIAWQPASTFDQATVERATRTIAADAIAARLLDEIAVRQSIDGAEIQLDNPALRFTVAAEAPDNIGVEGFTIDARSGRFSTFVVTPAGDANGDRQRVSGRLIRMADLPVPNRPIAPGEIIGPRDIETMRLRAERVGADVVVDLREIVGKTPRRPLRAHEPLRMADIQAPVIVHKGDLVTIVLQTPTMQLTAQGKAGEDGGMGATIHVANTKSNRIIDAKVIGPNIVAVGTTAQLAAR